MYEKFAELLKEHGGTIHSVAQGIDGVSSQTIYDWRDGKSKPKIDKLCKIANYFGVPVTEFIDDTSGC